MALQYLHKTFFGTALAATVLAIVSCNHYEKNSTHQSVSDESIRAGEQLAATYCKSCHLQPDPSLLNSKTWEKGVLPAMGPMLGIFNNGFEQYPSYRKDPNLGPGFYPSEPLLNPDQWLQIVDYYTALSPDSLAAAKDDHPISEDLHLFSAVTPAFKLATPRICYLKFDSVMVPGSLLLCDANQKNMYRFDKNLQLIDSVKAGSIVDVDLQKQHALACNMGIMVPNNGRHGTMHHLGVNANGQMYYDTVPVFDSLRRPLQITSADFNKDGKSDYLICEYGNLRGGLSWMENKGNNRFEKHVIREVPGTIKAWITDDNRDGLPDIYVLFAQGDESIFRYTNKGNGKFEEKRLLRFPPCYGSTYFELTDFNKDGFPDIVYTCGDNADYSPVLKPYHGVYIFMNDGHNNFEKQYFFHINGCFKAVARDFDNDGDVDIAAISFFADYQKRPEEGFVLLENEGGLSFKASSMPETKLGRWLTMDAGDFDGDGKIDIVLGNFSAPEMIKPKIKHEEGPTFLLLKNTGK